MISRLMKHAILLQKILIGVLVAWGLFMLVEFWRSGAEETKEALATGKRFIVAVDTGAIQGQVPPAAAAAEKKAAEAKPVEPVPAVPAVPPPEEAVAKPEELPPIRESKNPIAAVDEQLTVKENAVTLPRVSGDGRKPWQVYSKSYKRVDERPLVAIIVTELGMDKDNTQIALSLDENIVLSFSPYARAVASWVNASRTSGHETFIDLPVQTSGYPLDDPGPYSLLISHSNTQNLNYLYWALSRVQGYMGVVMPANGVLSSSTDASRPIIGELAKRGVFMLMGHEPLQRETKDVITQSGLSNLVADVWADEELTEMGIQARLATLEQIAQRKGSAIGIVRGYPLSLKQVAIWREKLEERGVLLAPVSFIAKLGGR